MTTYTKLFYHIIFSTKNRLPLITGAWEVDLHEYMAGILKRLGGMPLEIDGVEDHVHTLTALPPTLAVSDVLEKLKTCSSKWVNDNKLLGRRRFAWQRGYGAFTVSASRVPTVRAYIRNQKRHHKTKDFKAEFLTMLRKNGIDFDERYIWD